jgi:hypothetical protein
MSEVTVFAVECATLVVTDKKGTMHAVTPEGALFRGKPFIDALKDAALSSALSKAMGGRYHAASDIMVGAFPSIGKAAEKLIGTPWANKSSFSTLVNAVLRAESREGRSFSDKQLKARMLASAWSKATTPAAEVAAETIEA